MKKFWLGVFACVIIVACNKSSSSTLTGRWKVVNDSTITSGVSVSYNMYNGNDNDYFDFATNGLLQTRENGTDETYSYEIKPANTINITLSGLNINVVQSGIYVITGNQARISVAPNLTDPGFSYQRIINLKR